tara:strand:+ start:928 stop:1266 length:339 start_codon:yes stop_codon:yes gene_type:complete
MTKYASGKHAFGFCDRTGFRYKLKDLKHEYNAGVRTGLRVGKDVYDTDHPQNFLGRYKVSDPQALQDPRPTGAIAGRGIFGFNPVGDGNLGETGTVSLQVTVSVGTVEVTVS